MASANRLRSLPQLLAILLALGTVIGQNWRPLPTAAASASQSPPLDLAAIVLTPADLTSAGQEGFGLAAGRSLSVDNLADRVAWPEGQGETFFRTRDALITAGWSQGYVSALSTIRNFDNPGPVRDVEIEIVAYTDADGASAAFDLVPDAYATGDMTDLPMSQQIGDKSRLTRVDAHDPGAGTPVQELVLGFRSGRLTAHVLIRDLGGATPEPELAESLARTLLEKMNRALAGGSPELGLHALRVMPKDDMTVATDGYLRLSGEDMRSSFESIEDFADRTATYGNATDVFSSYTPIPAADSTYGYAFGTTLYQFASDGEASEWLNQRPDYLMHLPNVTESETEIFSGLGDEAVGASIAQDLGDTYPEITSSAIVLIRVGPVVAEVRLEQPAEAPLVSAVRELAELQVACLAADNCLDLIKVSISSSGELVESPQDQQVDARFAAVVP